MKLTVNRLFAICIICCSFFANAAYGQESTLSNVNKLIKTAENYFEKMPAEKLYLHFDKPYYSVSDTIWFKSYLLKSADYTASQLSSKLYVELINDSSKLITQLVIPLSAGLGQGYFALGGKLYDGNYRIRAYTNWMQNFGEDAYFNKQFYIGKPSLLGSWMINEQHTIRSTTAGDEVNLALQLNNLDGKVIPYRDVELKLLEGRKTILKSAHVTSDAGALSTSFTLSPKTDNSNLTLLITDKTGKSNPLTIPFYPAGAGQNIDLQFMPEGGSMIAGLYNKVAFKAIGDDGRSLTVKGNIVNDKNEEVTSLQTLHSGIGSFMMLPKAGESYTANVSTENGVKKSIPLTAVKTSGIALRVDNISRADSINIYITATPDIAAAKRPFTLMAQSKEAIHFGTTFNLDKGYNNLRIAKNSFNTGIVSFVILDEWGKPVNERKVFIDLRDQLTLAFTNSQATYLPKDSVAVILNVTDKNNKAMRGSFSVSVTDVSTVKQKGFTDNIASHFLLTSELKGNIEDPAWYLTAADATRGKALDNLLLAQGWTGYDWNSIPAISPKFEAEIDSRVSGSLEGFLKKPIRDANVSLFAASKKYGTILIDTTIDMKGLFLFKDLPLVDTIAYTIKVHDKKNKEIGAAVKLNLFTPAAIDNKNYLRQMPWYVNTKDSLMIKYFNRPGQPTLPGINAEDVKGKLLNEVVIKAKKEPVKINGEYGYPKAEITEKDLIASGKKTLADLIYQRFKSVKVGNYYSKNVFKRGATHSTSEYLSGSLLIADVFIDGQSVQTIYGGEATGDSTSYNQFLRTFFNYVSADDVKNMKLVEGEHAFMTITTRSGAGVFTRISAGTMAFRPLPMLFPKQFYSPKYTVKNDLPDTRTTIFWEPNVVTDEDGKAVIWFYAAGKPATYTITIEGTNMSGSFGFQTGKIIISNSALKSKVKESK